MITPLDIENKKFAKQMMNGYSVEEVDEFLDDLTIDYTKNYSHVKHRLNIRFVVRDKNNKPIRILSLFNLGLTIFRRCYNSYINYKIKCNMQLYL